MIRQLACVLAIAGVLALLPGCSDGGPQSAEEMGIAGAEVQNANSIRQDLEGLMETLDSEGASAAAVNAQSVEENVAALVEDPASAPNVDAYKQIAAGITELKGMSSKPEMEAKLKELQEIADGLPKE